MNNPNPFVPKGSLLEQQTQRRSRLKIVVLCVVAVGSFSLMTMLLTQGCHRESPVAPASDNTATNATDNNPPPMDTNVANMAAPPMVTSNATTAVPPTPQPVPMAPLPVTQPPAVPDVTAGTEYVIVSGDTLGKIAKAHGVSVKAIETANPGVDPKKLMPGKKIVIPAAGAATTAQATAGATDATGSNIYVVKSGDVLAKIAKSHGVTLKALRAANPKIASTDHINVGDKLVIPAKSETATNPPTVDPAAAAVPLVPAPVSNPPAAAH